MLMPRRVMNRVMSEEALQRLAGGRQVAFPPPAEGSPPSWDNVIRGAEIILTSWNSPPLSEALLQEAPQLKLLLHAAGSVKSVVTDSLWERGIRVVSSASVLSRGVAETALGLTIMSLKNIWDVTERTRAGDWWNNRVDEVRSGIREMYGLTIGCIGAGQAGRRYMELLRHFRVKVLLYDPTLTVQQAAALGAESVSMERLMSEADLVMVLAPEIPATYRMINEARLSLLKDDAVLINLARGSLVDESALQRRLSSSGCRLKVILDVTDPEPPPASHWLRTHPNIRLTGHIAGSVNNGLFALGAFVLDELERYESGEPLIGEIDRAGLNQLA